LALIAWKIGVFLQLEADVDRDRDISNDNRNGIANPRVEGIGAEQRVSPRSPRATRRSRASAKSGASRVVAAFLVGRMFGDVRDGAAVFTAEANPLDETQEQQQDAGEGADLGVAGTSPMSAVATPSR